MDADRSRPCGFREPLRCFGRAKSPQEYGHPLRINRRCGNQSALGNFRALVRNPMPPGQHIRLERRLRLARTGRRQETSMNHSIYSADRTTHLKVVIVALIAGILVAGFGISMRNSSDEGLTQTARVMKAGKPVMVTTSNKSVKS